MREHFKISRASEYFDPGQGGALAEMTDMELLSLDEGVGEGINRKLEIVEDILSCDMTRENGYEALAEIMEDALSA